MQGKIVKIISNLYTIETNEGLMECRARGKFRKDGIIPLVGDQCLIDKENHYILEIMPRNNELSRPMIANVDVALLVTSVKEPNLSLTLLDKMISIISIHKVEPILIFTKLDLLNQVELKEFQKLKKYYETIGYLVFTNEEKQKIMEILKDKVVVVTGQTGAGKSTLINKLDPSLQLKTDIISEKLGRGKHTTRHVELFRINNFSIADTPGFSSIDFLKIDKEQIRDSFIEFKDYNCPFKDCMHDKEKNCEVKKAVMNNKILLSRYTNYISFIKNK